MTYGYINKYEVEKKRGLAYRQPWPGPLTLTLRARPPNENAWATPLSCFWDDGLVQIYKMDQTTILRGWL